MSVFLYLALFLSAIIGGLLGSMLQRDKSKKYLTFVLPLSGAFLLGVAVLHMLPEVFYKSEFDHAIGTLILAGFLLQNILEFFSRGVEHGHIHVREQRDPFYIFSIMFGLCAHAFIEGLPVGHMSGSHAGHEHHLIAHPYLWGIVAHKLPAALALSVLLVASKVGKTKIYILLFTFALMSPLGTLASELITFSTQTQRMILAISIGFILHIATTIIFETDVSSHHKISYNKIIAVLLGFVLAFLSII